jgi:sterol 3beta-glucosyltransferase
MQIDILAIGSHGDVQPCVSLGLGLSSAGHQVRIVTLGGFEQFVAGRGLEHLSLGLPPGGIVDTEAGREWIERRGSALGFARSVVQVATALITEGVARYWQGRRDLDAMIVTPMGLGIGMHVAERLGVPMLRAAFAPTRHDWGGPRRALIAMRKDAAAALFRRVMWTKLRPVTNAARREVLELPPLSSRDPYAQLNRKRVPVLDAYSPSVVPSPPGCDGWLHVTGYWFLDSTPAWQPSADLLDFMSSGPPPVVIGFGSTPFPGAETTAATVAAALRRTQTRGVLLAGGSRLPTGQISDDLFGASFAPHDWLFAQASAVVHHGGAGVTGAALRAGLPSVVVPVFADQPFWASRLFELGVSAPPIAAGRLTADALAAGIRLTSTGEMRRRAAVLGERIRSENGVARAVEAIHAHVAARPARLAGER